MGRTAKIPQQLKHDISAIMLAAKTHPDVRVLIGNLAGVARKKTLDSLTRGTLPLAHHAKSKPYPELHDLKAAITQKGMKMKAVAEESGLSHNYVIRILNGFAFSEPAISKIQEVLFRKP